MPTISISMPSQKARGSLMTWVQMTMEVTKRTELGRKDDSATTNYDVNDLRDCRRPLMLGR